MTTIVTMKTMTWVYSPGGNTMATVIVGANKRFVLTADTTTTLQMSTDGKVGVNNMSIRKETAGNVSYMVNAEEAELTAVPQADANTLTDDFPSRDFYKPGKIYKLVVRADAEITVELDTNITTEVI